MPRKKKRCKKCNKKVRSPLVKTNNGGKNAHKTTAGQKATNSPG